MIQCANRLYCTYTINTCTNRLSKTDNIKDEAEEITK